jgi:hypothetical protein
MFATVLWIRDILVRILIRGSVPQTYGSGLGPWIQTMAPDSALFVGGL